MSQLSQDSLLSAGSGLREGLQKGFQTHFESEDFHLAVLTWSSHFLGGIKSGNRSFVTVVFPLNGWRELSGASLHGAPQGVALPFSKSHPPF